MLIVRHDKKGPPAPLGEAGRGSNAAAGACDILMGLRKIGGKGRGNRRDLEYLGRLDGLPPKQVIEWELEDRTYRLLGTRADLGRCACRDAVLDVLSAGPAIEAELKEATGRPRTTVQTVLTDLIGSGEIERIGEGVKGDPHRYRIKQ